MLWLQLSSYPADLPQDQHYKYWHGHPAMPYILCSQQRCVPPAQCHTWCGHCPWTYYKEETKWLDGHMLLCATKNGTKTWGSQSFAQTPESDWACVSQCGQPLREWLDIGVIKCTLVQVKALICQAYPEGTAHYDATAYCEVFSLIQDIFVLSFLLDHLDLYYSFLVKTALLKTDIFSCRYRL